MVPGTAHVTAPFGIIAPWATSPIPRTRAGVSDLYRAVWRWHFYAGPFVPPLDPTLIRFGRRRPASA